MNILPSMSVDKIVLESGTAGYNKKLKDNPHINEETQYMVVNDPISGKLIKYALGNSQPKAEIHNIVSTDGNTKVTVTVLVQDQLTGKSDLPMWIDSDMIKKFLAINIVAVKDTKTLDDFLAKHIEKTIRGESFTDLETNKVRHFKINLNEVEVESGANDSSTGPRRRATGSSYAKYDPNTRKNVYYVPYTVTFEIPDTQSNLMLVSFISVDLNNSGEGNPLVDEFGINPTNFDVIYSAPLIERVLSSTGVASTTDYFVTPDGMPWAGPIHYHPPENTDQAGKYMTGHKMSATSVDLSKKRIQNNKITDFRRIERLTNPRVLDFTSIENLMSQFNNRLKMTSEKPLYAGKQLSYMSELYMTPAVSTRNGTINNMFFVMDYRKMIKNNSLFPSLLDFPQKLKDRKRIEDILSYSEILLLEVYREKLVNKSEALETILDVDENIPPELIVSTSDSSNKKLISKLQTKRISYGTDSTKHGNLEKHSEVSVGSIREITNTNLLESTGDGARFFTLTDGSVSNLSGGTYQYTIKLRIRNGVHSYLMNKISTLRSHLRPLRSYRAMASKGADNKGAGSWDNIYKRFTKQFIGSMAGRESTWENAIDAYLDCAQLVYDNSGDLFSVEGTRKNLKNMCAPRTGSPKGIDTVIRLIEEFIVTLTDVLGSVPSLDKDGLGFNQNTVSVENKGTSSRRIFEHEYTFSDILEVNFMNSFSGYEFLGSSMQGVANLLNTWQTKPGIKQMSRAEYDVRVSKEIEKYILPNVTQNTSKDNLEMAVIYHDPTVPSTAGAPKQRFYSDFVNAYDIATRYLTPTGVRFTGGIADLLEGQYTGFYQSETNVKALSTEAVISLVQHVVAGSYSTRFIDNKTFNQRVSILYGTAVERKLDTYLSVLEKYNCHIVPKDTDEHRNYVLQDKPSENNFLYVSYESQTGIYILDEDGNEILNPLLEGTPAGNAAHKQRQSNIKSSTGRKYDYIMGTKEDKIPGIMSSVGIMMANIFPNHLDNKLDYNLASQEARMTKILVDKPEGKQYVNNLPLPLWTMLLEQQPTQYGSNSALRRGMLGIEDLQGSSFPYSWMIYKNIVAVEALIGFKTDERYVDHLGQKKKMQIKHMAAPNWAPLTNQLMESLLANGAGEIVCRLRRYYNDDFNVSETKLTTDVPIMNQYFTINLADATMKTTTPVAGSGYGGGGGGY
tara:strand:+ start:2787 stop:6341 length:3555 start_codon:yes stop_codon:yes gene_type:complete